MLRNLAGSAAALAAVALWATNAWSAGLALRSVTVLQLLTLQFGAATVAVLGCVVGSTLLRGRRARRRPPSLEAVAVGVVGVTGTIFLQYAAFASAPLVAANVLAYSWPLLTVLAAAVLVRKWHALLGVLWALTGFSGVVLIFLASAPPGGASESAGTGYALALGSAGCMALYTVVASRSRDEAVDYLLPATALGAVCAGVGTAVQGAVWPSISQWWPAIYIGLGPMAAGYGLWTVAVAGRRGERLAPLAYATPLLSTALLLATGASASLLALFGIALVLGCSVGALVTEHCNQLEHRRDGPSGDQRELPVREPLPP